MSAVPSPIYPNRLPTLLAIVNLGVIALFLALRPPATEHMAEVDARLADRSDVLRIIGIDASSQMLAVADRITAHGRSNVG